MFNGIGKECIVNRLMDANELQSLMFLIYLTQILKNQDFLVAIFKRMVK